MGSNKKLAVIGLILLMVCGLGGCFRTGGVQQVAKQEPIEPGTKETKPIMFKRILVTLPRGKVIGNMYTGSFCRYKAPLCWKADKTTISDFELGDVLMDELKRHGYTVVGDPDALFEDRSADKAEYLIAARIKDIRANVCYPRGTSEDWVTASGEIYVSVEWELYSRKLRDVVVKVKSEGSAVVKGNSPQSYQEIFYQAFSVAARNMLAHKEFYQAVAMDKQGMEAKKDVAPSSELRIRYASLSDPDKKEKLSKEKLIGNMRTSVVTVFSGSGHGSGFLISGDGYVLTNEHVVGGARFVNVRFMTGREVAGEVVRVNKVRDVSLIKLEKDNYPFLPLGESAKLNIGDEVYSIGTPLSEDLSQTVTKGIVSSFRIKDEIRYLQSDVNIHPGNSGGPLVSARAGVVGICVSGITFGPYTLGLNYFIPIEDAISALKVVKSNS